MIVNILNNQDRNLRGNSKTWANRMSKLAPNTCPPCAKQHGKIIDISFLKYKTYVAAHAYCQCIYVPMRTKVCGTATSSGIWGTDMYLSIYHKLPNYYITKDDAIKYGWLQWEGNLNIVLPGRVIGGDVYTNRDGKLPDAAGRIWYEADINYSSGYRNNHRILYSNDGLMFVTYDHYKTFYEITA